jgi:lipopolysaccharide export system permease protein
MLKRFDRHTVRRLGMSYVFLIAILVVFYVVLDYVENVDDFMDRQCPITDALTRYYPNLVPEIIRLISPLALFLSVVFVAGKQAQHLELAALQTSGVSIYRILIPYVLVGLTVSAGMFFFNGWRVPVSQRVVLDFQQSCLKDAPKQLDTGEIHRLNAPGSLITINFFNRKNQTGYNPSLLTFDESNRMVQRIDAKHMQWIDSLGVWRFLSVTLRTFDPAGGETRIELAEIDTTLNVLPRDFARTERDVDTMTITEARQYIESLTRTRANNVEPAFVGYYSKFSYPVANLIVALLGVPLAAVRRRGGQAVQIVMGLLISLAYLAALKLVESYGLTGEIAPLVVSWAPHAAFFLLAVLMLLRIKK